MDVLSVVGLGKLGACTAACLAARGFDVLGIDINSDLVQAINRGVAPVYEPGLQDLIASAGPRLRATQDYGRAIDESDVTFLIVPTPVQPDGVFSDAHLREALSGLSAPNVRIPYAAAYCFAVVSEAIARSVTHREPRASLTEVRMARKKMFFDSSKARAELGYEPGPINGAIARAIEFFRKTGAVRAAA